MSAPTLSPADTNDEEALLDGDRPTIGFRSFSPPIQRFLIATVINMTGTGMVFAFLFIYLNEVRGFSGATSGWIMAATPAAVVCCTPIAGFLSDRFGARRILTIGCVLSIASSLSFAFFDTVIFAVLASMVMGIANGLWFPAQSALLSLSVTAAERPAMSAFQRTALNLGAGLGGLLGGLIADKDSLASFQWIFAINALTYVFFLLCLPGLPTGRINRETRTDGNDDPGYRAVLGDRFNVLLLFSDIAIGLGFGFAYGLMPGYASRIGISERTVGFVFLLGAISVVIFQLPALRWVVGRQRMYALSIMNALFALGFVIMIITVNARVGVVIVAMCLAQILAGLGESALGAVRQPLTSDLAPPELIGRYFGLYAMVFHGTMGAANAIGGTLMDVSFRAVWIFALVASLYGTAVCWWLNRRIPEQLRYAQ
jgi:MFS family permease